MCQSQGGRKDEKRAGSYPSLNVSLGLVFGEYFIFQYYISNSFPFCCALALVSSRYPRYELHRSRPPSTNNRSWYNSRVACGWFFLRQGRVCLSGMCQFPRALVFWWKGMMVGGLCSSHLPEVDSFLFYSLNLTFGSLNELVPVLTYVQPHKATHP